MAKPTTLIFSIATALDGAKLNSDLTTMRDTIKKYPVKINIDVASETGKSLTEKLGGGEQFFNMVQQSVGSVGKLKTEYSLFADAAGKAIKIATSETKEYRDETGNVIREVISLKTEEQALAEAIKQGGTAKTGAASVESNWRKQAELTKAEINKEMNAVTANTKAAEKYLEKSKNMRGPQVEAAKKAAQAVIDEGKALQKASPLAKDFGDKVEAARKANDNFKVSLEGVKTGANVFQNFSSRITNAIQQTIAYSFSIGLVYKAQQLLNDSVKYAIDLNTEMTKIQVLQAEGAKTPEEINTLANSFNKLGQEMGVSTLEIAKGSVEWFRQGRTVEETQNLMKASMMLSKLGAMESADATNYLTSITNAFKISVDDTTSVVDKLIAVDNIAATSAGELATALRYTSESAALAGVGMEQLISYIGTVSTVTRQNAEMIGQAFKTMFARMTLIQGGGTDEEGWTISKVEKALSAVGIEMKKADGTFRNMGDVLEDTAAKWDTLGERERIEIAVAIGGVRQKEAFLVLMDNMDKALQYQAAQYDANGLAMDRYGIYMESIQAKQGKLTASMQELYASVVNSKMISAFYDIAIGMVQTITQGHLLIPILSTILYLMWAINREAIQGKWTKWTTIIGSDFGKLKDFLLFFRVGFIAATQASKLAGQSFSLLTKISWGLSTALKSVGVSAGAGSLASILSVAGPIILAIGAITIAYQAYKKGIEETKKLQEEALKTLQDYASGAKEAADEFKNAKTAVGNIKDLFAIPEAKRTEEDLKRLQSAFDALYAKMPYLAEWKFANGKPYLEEASFDALKLNDALDQTTQLTQEEADQTYSALREQAIQYHELGLEILKLQATKEAYYEVSRAAYNNEITTAAEANEKITEVLGKYELPTMIRRQLFNQISQSVVDESSWGKLNKDFSEKMLTMSNTAGKELGENETAKDILENSIKLLLSRVVDDMSPNARELWTKILGLDSLKELTDKALSDQDKTKNPQISYDKGEVDFSKEEEARLKRIKDVNDLYDKQLQQINMIRDGLSGLQDISEDNTKSQLDFDTTVSKFVDEINNADIKGLSVTLDDFKNKTTHAFDIDLIKKWGKANLKNAGALLLLKNLDTDLYNSVVNGANSASAAIDGITYSLNTSAGLFRVSKENAGQAMDWLAQSAFNTATAMGQTVQITANTGEVVVVNSLNDILTLVNNSLITEDAAMKTLIDFLVKYAVDAKNTIGTVFSDLTKGFPLPKPISYPTGGGGGGGTKKDPRAEALEKQIKAYEDEIELMQEQLEIYDEQIDAIDDLIEIENRKKEVIQDQIDIYEAQKDALDRQIDVLQQQIDLLDRQVEMLNRQTAEIDRQIEMYQREISLIDREIEMYERQKALIDELITAQEELIKPLEEQKDAIDKQLSSFKEAIDLQKEALQLRKEEADFLDELTKKNKALANLEAEIAIASLDTSEEGIARRLKLEEEAAAAREDLAKTQEDREYDLQVRGLDDAYAAFEKGMNAQKALLDDQIAKIQEIIDKYNTQKEAIDALIVPLEAEKLRIDDIIYGLEQQKIPIEDAIFRLEQEKIRIEDLIYPLEQQKIALDELIYPLTLQQEAIDLIIHQYEDEKRAIEDLKKPIEDNIELIGDKIEVLQDELDKINEIKNAIGGGGGLNSTYNDHTLAVKLAAADIIGYYGDILEKIGLNKTKIEEMIQAEVNLGLTAEQAKWKVCAEIDQMIAKYETLRLAALAVIYAQTGERPQDYEPTPAQGMPEGSMEGDTEDDYIPPTDDSPRHEGGFASKHGPDVFEGTLKDSEIFAKLLKGEYVATEDQMRNFLRKTLPSIASEATKMLSDEKNALRDRARTSSGGEPKNINGSPTPPSFNIEAIKIISPSARPSSELIKPISKPYENTYKDMNFEMNINVEGSLDKTVLPALKKSVIKEINKSLERRGIRRTADSFAI